MLFSVLGDASMNFETEAAHHISFGVLCASVVVCS